MLKPLKVKARRKTSERNTKSFDSLSSAVLTRVVVSYIVLYCGIASKLCTYL